MADVVATLPARDQIGRMWRSYRVNVLPARCSPAQENGTRNAFYAGAFSALSEMDATAKLDIPALEKLDRVQAMMDEVNAYRAGLVKRHG